MAKLHNLDTLRRHVIKTHCRRLISGGIPCGWEGCARLTHIPHARPGQPTHEYFDLDFNTEQQWEAHMTTAHLDPVAWQLGDGPSVASHSEVESDKAYASDSKNRPLAPAPADLVVDQAMSKTPVLKNLKDAMDIKGEMEQKSKGQNKQVMGRQGALLVPEHGTQSGDRDRPTLLGSGAAGGFSHQMLWEKLSKNRKKAKKGKKGTKGRAGGIVKRGGKVIKGGEATRAKAKGSQRKKAGEKQTKEDHREPSKNRARKDEAANQKEQASFKALQMQLSAVEKQLGARN